MISWSQCLAAYPANYEASAARFGGLGVGGLATIIVVAIILIVTVVWLINGTRKRD